MSPASAIAVATALAVALGACGSDDHYLIITVDAPPAVHDATALAVTLSNAGTTRTDSLSMRGQAFPITFSISSPGRTGELAIAIDATDAGGLGVGRGSATTTIEASDVAVQLGTMDFVVNTDYAGNQFVSDDFEANGFQLAALPDGTWTAAFRDGCVEDNCTVFARRFDASGRPLRSDLAASSNAFALSAEVTDSFTTSALASSGTTTVAVWDAFPKTGDAVVACRALDAMGGAATAQTSIATGLADVVAIAPLATGDLVVSWTAFPADEITDIRATIIKPDCTVVSPPQVVSTPPQPAVRGSVAAGADRILFAWISEGNVHIRLADNTGAPVTADTMAVAKTDSEEVAQARVAAIPGGFALVLRWTQLNADPGTGRLELLQLGNDGAILAAPTLITDRSAANGGNFESFGLATRSDGTLLAVWHTCAPFGDDNQCGVFGRALRNGAFITDSFVIPTTTRSDQFSPSAVALPGTDAFAVVWNDFSGAPPDTDGQSARARIIYLP